MATDHIRYDLLTTDAMRGVLRRVLTDAAERGLPGEHHFFITFKSKADGVTISPRLLAQYPEEMTIILQHQFWDLIVTDDHFEVGLSFGGVPERLVVPFSAIKSFFDPSVQFGLQFEPAETAEAQAETAGTESNASEPSTAPSPAALAVPADPSQPAAAETEDKPKPGQGAEVVRLDRFRKK
ncbi:SspB family protein [Nitrobacter sp.]|uniref:SspB family protein n=1 Tax=unclassified Nitrobacter TaxID=2620411 RepID=UPI002BA4FF73|nr:ClpXP protease specificity-enhancing factor SspB [Nitrobacter sp.]